MSKLEDRTFFPKECTSFVVKNIAPFNKTLRVFRTPIRNGATYDLLNVPDVSEAVIRHSLLKGELRQRFLQQELYVVESDIDLLQFNECHKTWLQSIGITKGLEVTGTGSIPFLFIQGVELIGVKNGTNRVFTTPDDFINGSFGGNDFRVLLRHNGRVLVPDLDFVVSESGGVGTGFDTITLLTFAPNKKSELYADYVTEA